MSSSRFAKAAVSISKSNMKMKLFQSSSAASFSTSTAGYPAAWEKLATKEIKGQPVTSLEWTSPEGIKLKPLYTAADVNNNAAGVDVNKEEAPGVYPFKRGPYATMYTAKP